MKTVTTKMGVLWQKSRGKDIADKEELLELGREE
jgi:hypothetical protein